MGLLLVAVAAFLLNRYAGDPMPGGQMPTVRTPIAAAKGAACRANLRTVRQAIEAYRIADADGQPPASTDVLSLPVRTVHCAVGSQPYIYDAARAEIRCPHPGHEAF